MLQPTSVAVSCFGNFFFTCLSFLPLLTYPNQLNSVSQIISNLKIIFLIGIVGGGVQLGPLGTAATNRPIVPAQGDYDDGEIGGMIIGRGNRSTLRKPSSVLLCPPQTPHAYQNANLGQCIGKPVTNCMSYCMAFLKRKKEVVHIYILTAVFGWARQGKFVDVLTVVSVNSPVFLD
jgi:hypothetical protein